MPIYKKGAKNTPGNYSPVSLTSIVCKVMEKLIRTQVTEHVLRLNLFSNAQFGFRSGGSCTLQLLKAIETWAHLIDKGEVVDALYLDFQKAFNTVPHRKLCRKLHTYGIRGNLLGWIESFLIGRT